MRPEVGLAILWYNFDASGKTTRQALHGGCPVFSGIKYGINAWVWTKPLTGANASTPAEWDPWHPALARARPGWDPATQKLLPVKRVDGKREVRVENRMGTSEGGDGNKDVLVLQTDEVLPERKVRQPATPRRSARSEVLPEEAVEVLLERKVGP